MPDTPDDKSGTPKKSKPIKLGLFIPWDEQTGRLFNEERFIKPSAAPDAQDDSKIIPFRGSTDAKKDQSEDTPNE